MLTGVRDVAFGATIVMAGLLAVMVVSCAWIVFFLPYVPFVPSWWIEEAPWDYILFNVSANSESLIGVTLMIWLVGRMIRRVSKSIAAGR